MGQGSGGVEDGGDEGEEGRPRTGGAHGADKADAVGNLAIGGSAASLDADGGVDQLTGEGRGDGQGKGTLGLGEVGTDEDLEGWRRRWRRCPSTRRCRVGPGSLTPSRSQIRT